MAVVRTWYQKALSRKDTCKRYLPISPFIPLQLQLQPIMSLVLSSIIEGWMRRSTRTTHHQPTDHSSTSFARMQSTYPIRPWKLCSISKTPVEHTLSRDKPLDRKRFVKMDNPLDQTTLTTISLLESRLLRIEHVLHGHAASHPAGQAESAIQRIQNLEKRFSMLISRIRVYGELLKICKSVLALSCPSETTICLERKTARSLTPF